MFKNNGGAERLRQSSKKGDVSDINLARQTKFFGLPRRAGALLATTAFTLAETLITLSLIGVVATITISSIHRKWFDSYSVSAVKDAYAMFDTAIKQMLLIEGKPMKWNWPDKTTTTQFGVTYTIPSCSANNQKFYVEKLSKYLRITKVCTSGNEGCFNYGIPVKNWFPTQYWLNGTYTKTSGLWPGVNNNGLGLILANGMHVSFYTGGCNLSDFSNYYPQNGGYRGMLFMRFDINGPKGPNRW